MVLVLRSVYSPSEKYEPHTTAWLAPCSCVVYEMSVQVQYSEYNYKYVRRSASVHQQMRAFDCLAQKYVFNLSVLFIVR